MVRSVLIDEFLDYGKINTIIDVRTPAEFEKGHIEGAINIPLFTNDERIIIGTLYKQVGRQEAIIKGLELVGPKLAAIVNDAKKINTSKKLYLYCWRGGMRSSSVAWLLETYGFECTTLKGGYKAFRRKIIETFAIPYKIKVLGGKTGSGKSKLIQQLNAAKIQTIDLEQFANHKGSSFGHIGEKAQPTQETFENKLGMALMPLDKSKSIWIEDESRMIGYKHIPEAFFNQMRYATVFFLEVDFEKRVNYLANSYGKFDKNELIAATLKIEKRLGPQQTKDAVMAISENRMHDACRIILNYYDKTYEYGLGKRDASKVVRISLDDENDGIDKLIKHS